MTLEAMPSEQKRVSKLRPLTGVVIAVLVTLFAIGSIRDVFHPLSWIQYVRPSRTWAKGSPEAHGMNRRKLDQLTVDLENRGTQAFLIVRNSSIVYERYARGFGSESRFGTASTAKSVVGGMALWVALSDGLIALDDPAWKYIPEWKHHPLKSRITIRQLADHSSGLKDARQPGASDVLEEWEQKYWGEDRHGRYVVALGEAPVTFEPGSRHEYSNPGMTALSYAITVCLQSGGHRDIRTLLRDRVMRPIGVPDGDWSISYGESYEQYGMDLYIIGGGGRYTARSLARVGELVLHKGEWHGHRIADAEWLERMLSPDGRMTPREPGMPRPAVGGWMTNLEGTWPSLPRDAVAAVGANHKVVLIVPSLELVMVRLGTGLTKTHWDHAIWQELEALLFRPLMESMGVFNGQSPHTATDGGVSQRKVLVQTTVLTRPRSSGLSSSLPPRRPRP